MPSDHLPTERDLQRLTDRAYQELLGIARGVLWDGRVSDEEIVRLHEWCEAYPEIYRAWPGDVLARRVRLVLEDGVIEDEERADLKLLLDQLTGGRDTPDRPTTLPITQPTPAIAVPGRRFCLTGTFLFGSRRRCEEAITTAGGTADARITRDVDYLVIGHHVSPAWAHSTHGRKIEAAVELRRTGHRVAIIAEELWSRALLQRLELIARDGPGRG